MTSREMVIRTIKFEGPDRLPYDFPLKYGSDFANVGELMDRSRKEFTDVNSPSEYIMEWTDEWGTVWQRLGQTVRGEAKKYPLESWDDLKSYKFPDFNDPHRWEGLEKVKEQAGDMFLLGNGIEIYERVHFLRGLENTWVDIYEEPELLEYLLDKLVDVNLNIIRRYGQAEVNGFISCDDWGLQDRLMISPKVWRKIWKPRYARMYEAAHKAGMFTFLHSCGYIVDILDDLIEIGLDVIHMDQQENMGLELLSQRFSGRITFFSPVDIQNTMARGNLDEIRAYCHKMSKLLGRLPDGGFIPRWYTDPVGVDHRPEAIDAMCDEFLKISKGIWQ